MAAFVIASLGATPTSGAAFDSLSLTTAPDKRSAPGFSQDPVATESSRVLGAERCPSVHKALRYYRGQYATWVAKRGVPVEFRVRKPKPCPRYLLGITVGKARGAHKAYEGWLERVTNDPILAIRYVFGAYAVQALVVADCESGLSRHAHNGQYLGLFQMGSSERQLYGHGSTFLAQARAAYRYFVLSGRDWSPWACRP